MVRTTFRIFWACICIGDALKHVRFATMTDIIQYGIMDGRFLSHYYYYISPINYHDEDIQAGFEP